MIKAYKLCFLCVTVYLFYVFFLSTSFLQVISYLNFLGNFGIVIRCISRGVIGMMGPYISIYTFSPRVSKSNLLEIVV